MCLVILILGLGLLAGLSLGERLSGNYKKKFRKERKKCDITYTELEHTREEIRKRSDEITATKARLLDIKEAAENYKIECDNMAEAAEEYFNRYTIISRIAIKHGFADVCNKALAENGFPTIEKNTFDECV